MCDLAWVLVYLVNWVRTVDFVALGACGFVHRRSLGLALGFVSLWCPPFPLGPWPWPARGPLPARPGRSQFSAGVVLVFFLKPHTCDVMLGRRVCVAHAVVLCLACHVT